MFQKNSVELTRVVPWLVHLAARLKPPQLCPQCLGGACPFLLIWQTQTQAWDPAIKRELGEIQQYSKRLSINLKQEQKG